MRTVMVVDDSETVAQSIATAVETMTSLTAIVASHPAAALRVFSKPGEKIHALVTDLDLPSLDGFELIRRIRAMPGYERIPVIMITAEEGAWDANCLPEQRPDVIFRKPFSIREVCRALENLLR